MGITQTAGNAGYKTGKAINTAANAVKSSAQAGLRTYKNLFNGFINGIAGKDQPINERALVKVNEK